MQFSVEGKEDTMVVTVFGSGDEDNLSVEAGATGWEVSFPLYRHEANQLLSLLEAEVTA